MYLKHFNQPNKCATFDPANNQLGTEDFVRNTKTSGFYSESKAGTVSIYPRNQELIIRVGQKQWDLLSSGIQTSYFHNYSTKETTFRISGSSEQFEITYPAWWADRDDFIINEMAASCEEENSEEDVFGYIHMLNENQDSANSLHPLWLANITQK